METDVETKLQQLVAQFITLTPYRRSESCVLKNMLIPRIVRLAAPVACLILVALWNQAAVGQVTLDWNNTTGTPTPFFDSIPNWTPMNTPTDLDRVRFTQPETYEVFWDTTTPTLVAEVGEVNLLSGNVTFLNSSGASRHKLIVNGSFDTSEFGESFELNNESTVLTLRGIELEAAERSDVLGGARLVIDGDHPAGTKFTVRERILVSSVIGTPPSSIAVSYTHLTLPTKRIV